MIGRGSRRPSLAVETRGAALIEFAMVLPFLVLLFVGGYQISDAVFAYRKVTLTAKTVADLTAQYTSVTDSDLDTILSASQQVLVPYKISLAKMIVSQVVIDGSGNATVSWSRPKNTTGYTPGAAFAVPAANKQNGTTIIVADVTYAYTPMFASSLIGSINLKEQVTMYPRKSTSITKS